MSHVFLCVTTSIFLKAKSKGQKAHLLIQYDCLTVALTLSDYFHDTLWNFEKHFPFIQNIINAPN